MKSIYLSLLVATITILATVLHSSHGELAPGTLVDNRYKPVMTLNMNLADAFASTKLAFPQPDGSVTCYCRCSCSLPANESCIQPENPDALPVEFKLVKQELERVKYELAELKRWNPQLKREPMISTLNLADFDEKPSNPLYDNDVKSRDSVDTGVEDTPVDGENSKLYGVLTLDQALLMTKLGVTRFPMVQEKANNSASNSTRPPFPVTERIPCNSPIDIGFGKKACLLDKETIDASNRNKALMEAYFGSLTKVNATEQDNAKTTVGKLPSPTSTSAPSKNQAINQTSPKTTTQMPTAAPNKATSVEASKHKLARDGLNDLNINEKTIAQTSSTTPQANETNKALIGSLSVLLEDKELEKKLNVTVFQNRLDSLVGDSLNESVSVNKTQATNGTKAATSSTIAPPTGPKKLSKDNLGAEYDDTEDEIVSNSTIYSTFTSAKATPTEQAKLSKDNLGSENANPTASVLASNTTIEEPKKQNVSSIVKRSIWREYLDYLNGEDNLEGADIGE